MTRTESLVYIIANTERQPNGALRLPADALGREVAWLYAEGDAFPAFDSATGETHPTLTEQGARGFGLAYGPVSALAEAVPF